MKLVLAVMFALFAVPALGATPYEIYAAGHYEDAIRAGSAAGNAAGYATAARAALADATTRSSPCLECLRRAEILARQAIAADPRVAEGHIYLAVAMGYEARIVGPVWARAHNYPGHAKEELDAALAIDPKSPWTLGALGGWNVEIVRTGGDTLADWLYGASVDKGLAAFAAAFKAAPDNLSVRYQYALSLSGYDPVRFRHEIEDAFARVAKAKPATVYESLSRTRAAELAGLLRNGNRAAFDAKVHKYQGYP